jgi:hypothetical protein
MMKLRLFNDSDFSLEDNMVKWVPRSEKIDIPGIAFPVGPAVISMGYHYIKVWEVSKEGIVQFDKEKLLRVTPSFLKKIKDLVGETDE